MKRILVTLAALALPRSAPARAQDAGWPSAVAAVAVAREVFAGAGR